MSFAQLPRKEPERRDAWCAFCRRGAGCGGEEGPRDGPGDGPGGGEGRVRVLWWASQRGVEGNGVVTKGTVGAVELSDSF